MSEDLYIALRNAEAAGDTASAKRLADYIRTTNPAEHLKPMGQSEYGFGTTAKQDAISKDVLSTMSGPERFAAGAGMNLARMGRFAGNKLGLIPDQAVNESTDSDAALGNTPGGAAGDFAGGMAWTAPMGMGATSGVSMLGKLGKAIATNPISRGAMEGAVQGGMQSPKDQTLKGMLAGGIAGTAFPTAVKGAQALTKGVQPTAAARELMNRGVELTPGQMNPAGMANQLESSWGSVPVIGQMFSGARKNAENQFKQELIKEAAAPGAKLSGSKDLNALLDEAYKSFEPAYDTVKGFPLVLDKGKPVIVNQGSNIPLSTAFVTVVKDKGVLASAETRRTVGDYLENQLTKPIKKSEDLLSVRSQLRTRIRSIKGTSQDDLAQKELLENAEHTVSQALESQLPPPLMQALKDVDAQYGKYKIVENAVAKGGDKEFTTFQASKAVHEATDKGEYARGGGRMRDLTSAGAETFIDTPQTGARNAAIAIPAGAIAAKPMVGIPAALGFAGLANTKIGRRIAAGDTGTQKLLQQLAPATVNKLSPQTQAIIEALLNRGSVQSLDKWVGTKLGARQQE